MILTPSVRFLVDARLARLGRHLRMIGVDALDVPSADGNALDDAAVRALAQSEGRELLAPARLEATDPTAQLAEVLAKFGLVEYARSQRGFLTRCLQCNSVILPVRGHHVADRLPGSVLLEFSEFYLCPRCERVSWNGSHVDRMKAWLAGVTRDTQPIA